LETHDEESNAARKLQSKKLDMIVLNSLQDKGAGFGVDTNKVTLLYADGSKKNLPLLSKQEVADAIINSINS
jgi:phosphopantothenoylcysteine decarboxylase/phosphopantothenate--cysteine ligase